MGKLKRILVCISYGMLVASAGEGTGGGSSTPIIATPPLKEEPIQGVDWSGVVLQSINFLSVEHGFRLFTEPGTRSGMRGNFLRGYGASIGNLHGWADGDPFYVNYVGHPMM